MSSLNIVLLSGGSGKRLWPMSSQSRSKQFLKVIKPYTGDDNISMLQRVYTQLKNAKLSGNILIAANKAQETLIREQLGDSVPIIAEPERRNTFPAIALSCAYIFFGNGSAGGKAPADAENDTVAVLPVDPYVEDDFFSIVHKLHEAVQSNKSDIALIGVKPSYPAEKYGYIMPCVTGYGNAETIEVDSFKEKPPAQTAADLISKGGLWNCGVFAFKLKYVMDILAKHIQFKTFDDVLAQYSKLESTSFDYAVVEKAKSVSVIPYSGEWKDLGTWNTLTEVIRKKTTGNAIISDDCINTHVINELDIPVITIGARDMVIVSTPDGILVADKEQSPRIQKYVEMLNGQEICK